MAGVYNSLSMRHLRRIWTGLYASGNHVVLVTTAGRLTMLDVDAMIESSSRRLIACRPSHSAETMNRDKIREGVKISNKASWYS
jgi:predicted peroxiredoxin